MKEMKVLQDILNLITSEENPPAEEIKQMILSLPSDMNEEDESLLDIIIDICADKGYSEILEFLCEYLPHGS